MKKVIRKMNIGVLIGLVLFLATVVYVIVGNIVAESKKDDIKAFINEFSDECCQANIGNTEEVADRHKAVIGKYFSGYEPSYNYQPEYVCAKNISEMYETGDVLSYRSESSPKNEITDCKAKIRAITVDKLGIDCAKVQADFEMTMTIKGTDAVFSASGYPCRDRCEISGTYEDPVFSAVCTYSYIYYLSPSGDSWKIDMILPGNLSSYSFRTELISGKQIDVKDAQDPNRENGEVRVNE